MRNLICVLLAFISFGPAQAAEKQQVEQKAIATKTTTENKSAQPSAPVTINVTGYAQTVEKGANSSESNNQEKKGWWEKLWTDPIATFTGALFLATAALIVTGAIQWYETRQTARRQLRAYVSVYPGFLYEQDRMTGVFEARPKIKNNGQTPAYKVTFRGWTAVLPRLMPANFNFVLPPTGNPSVSTLGPGQDTELWPITEKRYSIDELHEILLAQPSAVYTYGVVTYEDTFGEAWTTSYCYFFIWGGRGIPMWVTAPQHNHAT